MKEKLCNLFISLISKEDLVSFPFTKSVANLICRVKSTKRASNKKMRLLIKHNLAVGGCKKYLSNKGKENPCILHINTDVSVNIWKVMIFHE